MAVTIAPNFVADSVQRQQLVFERLERSKAFFESEISPLFVRPERLGDNSIGTENNDQPLFASGLVSESKTRQIENKRECGSTDSQITQEFSAGGLSHFRSSS